MHKTPHCSECKKELTKKDAECGFCICGYFFSEASIEITLLNAGLMKERLIK